VAIDSERIDGTNWLVLARCVEDLVVRREDDVMQIAKSGETDLSDRLVNNGVLIDASVASRRQGTEIESHASAALKSQAPDRLCFNI
jgi:hypothetical protein